jgi:hypothetical protein
MEKTRPSRDGARRSPARGVDRRRPSRHWDLPAQAGWRLTGLAGIEAGRDASPAMLGCPGPAGKKLLSRPRTHMPAKIPLIWPEKLYSSPGSI